MKVLRTAAGSGAAIVTAHHLASDAGAKILADGGNAVDAAVGANAVLGVVAPETCGPGGDLFALVHRPGDRTPAVLNASGRAGAGAAEAADGLRKRGLRRAPTTERSSITVPGCVDGWDALCGRYGTRGLAALLQPAIGLAQEGFAASSGLVRALTLRADQLAGQPSAASMLTAGHPPRVGDHLRRNDLAGTLRDLAEGGREAFYKGRPAEAISAATGGIVTAEDLAAGHADWVDPISAELFGETAWTVPPNSQGYLTLAAAMILESLDPDPGRPDFLHLIIEAYRSVAYERDDLVADPDHAPMPAAELLSSRRLLERARSITPERAGVWPSAGPVPGGTTYLCATDREGLAVSLIQSNFTGIGSGIGAGQTGVFLQNRGSGFTTEVGHPNEMLPGKRPLHTLSPTLWTKGTRMTMLLGTRGGDHQPQFLLQAIARLYLQKTGSGEAQDAFRWAIGEFGPGVRDSIGVESRITADEVTELESRGHRVAMARPYEPGWGPISMIRTSPDGDLEAVADPRVDTTAAVVL